MNPHASEKIWTILDLVQWGKAYFEEKGVDSPRLTIELMLAHVLKMQRIQLYTAFDRPLAASELSTLRDMVRRRAKREPLQYILGEAHFYNIVVEVSPAVLIPRPETELLVEYVLNTISKRPPYTSQTLRLLDIGTGSGCIALALGKGLAEKGIQAEIEAWDVSEGALHLASQNAQRCGIENTRFLQQDILAYSPNTNSPNTSIDKPFDVIVSNPPYIPLAEIAELQAEVRDYEPVNALTDNADGTRFYRHFSAVFPKMLAPNGFFAVEMGFGQASAVVALFEENGFQTHVENDLAGIPRICAGWRR